MYESILKESGAYLTVLVVDEECEYRNLLDKKLSKYFKKFVFATNSEEALSLYENERFNIVMSDVDKESVNGLELISKIQKLDPCQSIFAYSEQIQNSSLLLHLINLGISGFIDKADEVENYNKVFSNVCKQKCEKKMLMYYIDELERAQVELYTPVEKVKESEFEVFSSTDEDDDFEFFSIDAAPVGTAADNSLYKDYFHLLDSEDREDLHDLLSDIDTTLINAFPESADADSQQLEKLSSLLMRYGNVLMHYQFFSDMGAVILEFGKAIGFETKRIIEQSEVFHSLISGFCSGLQVFLVEVWESESDNPKFFNDSIINDAGVIIDMIKPPVIDDNEDDLVFF